jgi:hypothetical protein
MIRVWHVLPFLSLFTSLGVGSGAAKVAGGGFRNYAIGVSLGCAIGALCGGVAWLFGRAALRKAAGKDPMQVGIGTVLGQQAVVLGWMCLSGILAAFATRAALGN